MSLLANPVPLPPQHLFVDHLDLWRHLGAVAEAVGVGVESVTIDHDPPVSAYIALDARSAVCPELPLALLWDEDRGWTAAVETGTSLVVLDRLDAVTATPDPAEVAAFLRAVTLGRGRSTSAVDG